jgi:hypothetical protein
MQFAIETGIPAPAKPVSGGKYPFAKLQVGDSFVVELEGRKSWAFLYGAITHAQKKHSIKLTSRLIEDGKRRVWRVA